MDNKANKEDVIEYIAPPVDADGCTDDLFVAVNGQTLLIRRGERVKIRRPFYEAIENAMAQEKSARAMMDSAKTAGGEPLAKL